MAFYALDYSKRLRNQLAGWQIQWSSCYDVKKICDGLGFVDDEDWFKDSFSFVCVGAG